MVLMPTSGGKTVSYAVLTGVSIVVGPWLHLYLPVKRLHSIGINAI